jgi:hypothetical protein
MPPPYTGFSAKAIESWSWNRDPAWGSLSDLNDNDFETAAVWWWDPWWDPESFVTPVRGTFTVNSTGTSKIKVYFGYSTWEYGFPSNGWKLFAGGSAGSVSGATELLSFGPGYYFGWQEHDLPPHSPTTTYTIEMNVVEYDWELYLTELTFGSDGDVIVNGLAGYYYDGINFNTLVGDRRDATINLGSGEPFPGVGSDSFSVRWIGFIQFPSTGTYRFRTYTDDGIRVWVNESLIINNWTDHGGTYDTSGNLTFDAGQRVPLTVEFYENAGGEVCRFEWEGPSISWQIVPESALFIEGLPTSGGSSLRWLKPFSFREAC